MITSDLRDLYNLGTTRSYKSLSSDRKNIIPQEACLEPAAEIYIIKYGNKPAGMNFYDLGEIIRCELPYRDGGDGVYYVGKTIDDVERLVVAMTFGDHRAIGEALGYPQEYIERFVAQHTS